MTYKLHYTYQMTNSSHYYYQAFAGDTFQTVLEMAMQWESEDGVENVAALNDYKTKNGSCLRVWQNESGRIVATASIIEI